MKRKRDAHREAGVCISCDRLASPGRTQCPVCLSRRSKEALSSSRRRVKNGDCYDCPEKATVGKYCLKHWFHKVSSFKNTGTRRNGLKLMELFYLQKEKCAYTGFLLIPGVNASVDHKIPKSKGGSHEIENLQWVDAKINRMKTDMTHCEFIEMCALVLSRAGGTTLLAGRDGEGDSPELRDIERLHEDGAPAFP